MEGSRVRKNWKQKKNRTLVATDRRCPKPSRLVVTDQKTNIQFLIAPDAQVSLFPKYLVAENSEEIEQSQVLVNNSGSIIHTFGQITREIDLGLGKLFSWKFTLVGFERPIIGRDFLSHFRLKFNFEKMCLENPETGLETMRISTVACECHRNENSNDGWPYVTAISKRSVNHRNHVTDKISKIPFLIGAASEISVFPKSKLSGENLEPFDGSVELHGNCEDVAQVLGWTTRKLDFGTGREFTWKFAVITSGMPIIGLDFLHKFGLVQQLKMGYFGLFDTRTKISTPAPSFPCGCGNRVSGWPTFTSLVVEPISRSENRREVQPRPGTSSENSGPSRQNLPTFDRNSRNHTSFRGFRGNSRPFRRHRSRKSKTTKEENYNTNPGMDRNVAEKKNYSKKKRFDVKHRLHVDDKNSKLPFLIGIAAQVSVFPKSEVKEEDLEPFDGSFVLKGCGEIFPILGWTTRTLDIGLPNRYDWKFAVIDVSKPILGIDFISHYDFSISGQSLIDKKTNLTTPSPSGPCDCGKVPDGWSVYVLTKIQVSGISKPDNQKKGIGQSKTESGGSENVKHRSHADSQNSKLPFSTGSGTEISVFPKPEVPEEDLEPSDGFQFENDEILVSLPIKSEPSREECGSSEIVSENLKEEPEPNEDVPHRFHVDDKNSKLPFLIGSAVAVSVFPKSAVKEEDLEPFDDSFELKGANGEVVPIFGWTKRTLDLGLTRTFYWKFAVINIGKPILGRDFLGHYRFAISGEGLMDSETNLMTPRPKGPCDCGKVPDGWPIISLLKKISSRPSETETKEDKSYNSKEPITSEESDTSEDSDTSVESVKFKEFPQQQEAVEEKLQSDVTHRFHVDDKNSKLPFLIGTAAEVSVFPKSEVKDEDLEPFDGSFELKGAMGEVVSIFGWTTRSLDIGLTKNFTWKFAVIDSSKPIIGNDFIIHYGFLISGQSLIDKETNLTVPPPSGPCDCGKSTDGWPTISLLTKIPVSGQSKSETETSDTSDGSVKLNDESKKNVKESEEKVKHEINHRFHLMDKNSETLFFISEMAQVSVFPRSQLEGRSIQVPEGSEIIDCVRLVFPVYGYVTLKIDFGLEREFEWKFAVVESSRPIIGLDFLKKFDLKTDYEMEYPRLVDPETQRKTAEFTGPCSCGDSYDFPLSTILRKSDSESIAVQEKDTITGTRCADEKCSQEERIILVERETQMPYLLSLAAVSVFPKSKAREVEIEPFDDSFNLINDFGSVVPIYGWITRKLDFGLGRYFMWKFVVINVGRPMISNDFLSHYGFTVDFENRSVYDYATSKAVIGSIEFCKCQAKCYWPDISMEKRAKKEKDNVSTDSTGCESY
ncbi:uncharacterized protein LOC117168564 [Belonocnema kinseyi]|uniref:uncharacterized protein LOC117168564 n=1 Tax=Belonocnema kinseyi TaxID=2817044 RepID=UPI00143CC78F|nr:uncharacterized protein LOC117168564 [Belonocnema kinseyi]